MLVYLLPYVFVLSSSYLYSKVHDIAVRKWHFLLMLMPATLIVVLRGNVGTDTLNYLQHFEQLHDVGISTQIFEPGFEVLTRFMVFCELQPRACVALIGFITILFFIGAFSKSKESILLFAIIIFPCYFYDMTMNGIRYGLSFSISALAIKCLYERKILKFCILSLLSISIQYSSLLIIFVFSISKLKIKHLLIIAFVLLATYPLYANMFEYLFLKQDAYKGSETPSFFSGFGTLFSFFSVFFSYFYFLGKEKPTLSIYLILLLKLLSFYMSRSSYAGLRLQSVFMFCLLIFVVNEFQLIEHKAKYRRFLFVLGLLTFSLWIKNYVGNVEETDAPFIPYRFFWSA